ncbi:DUF551 domain-containing protein [Ewingella americana]
MNNDLEQFSEERLKAWISDDPNKTYHVDGEDLQYLARIALAVKRAKPVNSPCEKCKSSGFMDSGGTQPWGETISVECDCTTPQPAHTEQASPVAWLLSGGGTKNIVSFDSGNAYADPLREVTPLYISPPADCNDLVGWVACSEKMPETYLNVLLTDEADDMCIGQLESHEDTDFFVVGCPRYKATHWMPLPAAPKPESE